VYIILIIQVYVNQLVQMGIQIVYVEFPKFFANWINIVQ